MRIPRKLYRQCAVILVNLYNEGRHRYSDYCTAVNVHTTITFVVQKFQFGGSEVTMNMISVIEICYMSYGSKKNGFHLKMEFCLRMILVFCRGWKESQILGVLIFYASFCSISSMAQFINLNVIHEITRHISYAYMDFIFYNVGIILHLRKVKIKNPSIFFEKIKKNNYRKREFLCKSNKDRTFESSKQTPNTIDEKCLSLFAFMDPSLRNVHIVLKILYREGHGDGRTEKAVVISDRPVCILSGNPNNLFSDVPVVQYNSASNTIVFSSSVIVK
ncbi:hypothetical protein AGLY_009696 [Aphis glycines]|uniref:Uncharacterized protein n=1 Tax=Aphis glycines TaxID=307491 RepID=A0A6G0THV5_APHGL|nr:hypothetical protein AGLY_009696 [Aphis glycines]